MTIKVYLCRGMSGRVMSEVVQEAIRDSIFFQPLG